MTRGSRKKKTNKRPRSPRVVPPSTKGLETVPLLPGVAKLQPDKTALSSKEIFVAAPAQFCFNTIANQFERPPEWDPMIVDAQPVSNDRGRIGATSQVTLNLGGRKLESLATICQYRPNRAITWVLTREPKVREDWQLQPKSQGTKVGVTLACESPGGIISRFLYRVTRWKRVEQDLAKKLAQLKAVAESVNRNRMIGG